MTAIDWAHNADCNVCIVDWSRLSNYNYPIAASEHTKLVANALFNFMHFLIEHGMNIEQVAVLVHKLLVWLVQNLKGKLMQFMVFIEMDLIFCARDINHLISFQFV